MYSARDALYTINFLKTIVSMRVPNLKVHLTFILSEIKNKLVSRAMHSCTESEARNLGLFLNELITLFKKVEI
jgi:hypothetical protein